MIKLSSKGDHAIKAIMFLIDNNDRLVNIGEIAREEKISESLLRRIIADLEKAKIITTIKGRNGGLRIERDLKEISLYSVLKAVGEDLGIRDCSIGVDCEKNEDCNAFPLYKELQKGFNGILKLYTLDKIKIGQKK